MVFLRCVFDCASPLFTTSSYRTPQSNIKHLLPEWLAVREAQLMRAREISQAAAADAERVSNRAGSSEIAVTLTFGCHSLLGCANSLP